jgi:hypothetical protein
MNRPDKETEVRREAARKAASDGSTPRPRKVPCVWNHVDFMEWETWQDLGLSPPAGEQFHWARSRRELAT